MIYNPIKILKLRRQAERDTYLANWVKRCLDDPTITFKSKIQLLSGYYAEHAERHHEGLEG